MELYNVGDRIEGANCDLYSRKAVKPSCLQSHPETGAPCMRVELSRNATAEITKELPLTDDEWEKRKDPHHNLGDKLRGESITVYVAQRRPITFTVKEGLTHTHGGHLASTKNPTLCEIKYAFEHIYNAASHKLGQSTKQIEKP